MKQLTIKGVVFIMHGVYSAKSITVSKYLEVSVIEYYCY